MADVKRTIDIVFRGSNRTTQAIRSIRTSIGGLGKGLGVLATAATAAAAALAAVGYKASREMAEGLADAYQEFATFESSLKDLEKVLGDHPEQLDKARVAAQELAVEYGMSSTKIVDSIANWVQAGYDLEEAMTLAEDSIATTYASELNMAEATDTLTKVLKGFGVEVSDARSKLDAINSISNNYAASVGQMSEALGRAAPVAESMGFSMEQLASIMTPAIEKFQNGQRVGTAFRTMLTKLQDDAKPVQTALEELGVTQKDANGQFKSGEEIFYEVGKAFQDLNKNQKAFIASQLAGREHASKFLATMGEWDQVSKVYETAMNSAGSITEEVENRLEAAQTQMDRFQAASESLAQVIGGQVAESFTNVVESSTDLVGALQDAIESGGAEDFFESINNMANDFAAYLDEIAEVLPKAFGGVDWSSLAGAFESVGDAFASWFKDLDLTTVQGLRDAIQQTADGTATLVEFFGKLVAMVDDVAKFGTTMAGVANQVIENTSATENAKYAVRDLGVAMGERTAPQAEILSDALAYAKRNTSGAKDELDKFNEYLEQNSYQATSSEEAIGSLQYTINTLAGKQVHVGAEADKDSARDAGEDVKDSTPDSVKVKAEAEVEQSQIEKEIAKIETEAETTQTAIEMKAKADISEVEAAADKAEAAFESVDNTISSTGGQISKILGMFADPEKNPGARSMSYLDEERERREEAHFQQMRMLREQVKMMRERRQQMEKGEAMINISGDGLQPHLESVMWEILREVQVKVNEEGMDMLMGTG